MDVYEIALKKWGEPLQIIMGIEEMAELTKELVKHLRGKGDYNHIKEEMADVEIMLTQLEIIFGDIRFEKDRKLIRLAKMLEEDESINPTKTKKEDENERKRILCKRN